MSSPPPPGPGAIFSPTHPFAAGPGTGGPVFSPAGPIGTVTPVTTHPFSTGTGVHAPSSFGMHGPGAGPAAHHASTPQPHPAHGAPPTPVASPPSSTATSVATSGASSTAGSPGILAPSEPRAELSLPKPADPGPGAVPPPPPALIQACQAGDIDLVEELLATGRAHPADRNPEDGTTALHWAALNGHRRICELLVARGGPGVVNVSGGSAEMTPLHWAVQRGHTDVVQYLIEHAGANHRLTDLKGFNALHMAAQFGRPMMLLLLLRFGLALESRDHNGRTPLMWAAYAPDPTGPSRLVATSAQDQLHCLVALLRLGADVYATDEQGYSALHWAVTRGRQNACRVLLEAGADPFLKTARPPKAAAAAGADPLLLRSAMEIAREKGHVDWFQSLTSRYTSRHVLAAASPERSPSARPSGKSLAQSNIHIGHVLQPHHARYMSPDMLMVYCVPYVFLGACFYMFTATFWPVALLLSTVLGYLFWLLVKGPATRVGGLHRTPILISVFHASLVYDSFGLLFMASDEYPPYIPLYIITTLIAITGFIMCVKVWFSDPGVVPFHNSVSDILADISQLVSARRFDRQNYCLTCMVSRPQRSKHDRETNRCVERFDHYCPWVHNVVGRDNHRLFLIFLFLISISMVLYVVCIYKVLSNAPEGLFLPEHTPSACPLGSRACAVVSRNAFLTVTGVWTGVNSLWVLLTLATQLNAILRGLTVNEVINFSRYSYLHLEEPASGGAGRAGASSKSACGSGSGSASGGPGADHHSAQKCGSPGHSHGDHGDHSHGDSPCGSKSSSWNNALNRGILRNLIGFFMMSTYETSRDVELGKLA
ncbi:hypothetical protein H696_02912 [Fonticula alba]|uniref:Palmitoyltransferase n=1 Tax=Fonticula alba TaxID=691883 RepID=A0A058ZAW3_FONAL|nr:hypothetical protein H696_02912 [Fonticula alba]KCV70567.1 hypothetical protein H696_02912 [Fonticula alba]|eukprot:XP_009495083.1 hypothetical protein H696_02912 [Fonticula alba]